MTPDHTLLDPARSKRIAAAFEADIKRGALPGAVVLIARRGQLAYLEAFGCRDAEKKLPMATDSIFRIASMTKPMVSCAVMMLVEEGKLRLINPVSTYLPALAGLKVGVETTDAQGHASLTLEAARREMTVQDLLRHTSGVTYGQFGDSLVKKAYRAADMMSPKQTSAEFIAKLSQLPLQNQPGEVFEYSMSTDVLGCLVEAVSGQTLDVFLAERITGPLGMRDTGFHIPASAAERVAEALIDPATGNRPAMARDLTIKPNFLSGGGGMVSTAPDYLRFTQMLAAGVKPGGKPADGTRLLARKTIALMSANHLPPGVAYAPATPAQFEESAPMPQYGQGFGLGFCVRTEAGRNPVPGSPGEFYWSGVHGTYFWVDPAEELIGILMTCAPDVRRHYRALMRQLTYQALAD